MRLAITHETRYHYSPQVQTAQHVAHLQPADTPCQKVISHWMQVEPAATVQHNIDAFLNHRSYWALTKPHDGLMVRAHSEIITSAIATGTTSATNTRQSWESVREHFRYRGGQPGDVHSGFVFGSHHAPVHEAFLAYAQSSFTPGRSLVQAAQELTARMHRDFRYESESTDINTPALEALAEKRGVCQDFAHIMLACLRSLGLPARYVSGYLLTQPPPGQPRLVGSDASHAWASVYLPELASHACQGWLDLDPTNDRTGLASPGEDYVRLAVGRDFADVSPLRGVLQGGGAHTLEVAVTVAPLDE
ncbi:MAG: transglutaminase family protein [Limnohabitans sp.]|mgnify:FL=1|jgi:transglutaminase-like putative cysteine protease|uniref:transglutaminase family protein n=1 Tax=Limnohabitans sp. TaxID=1907725 RepID=UPI001B6BA537|nr:transglutaminase family protein [Limnohabitans sp.]MBP6221682.1 transglutaminase family protein [Limnohabitans sp.]MBP6246214.1 transglutaminase family protein [Limnohabitans sp.]